MNWKRILWILLALVGLAPTLAVLLGGLYLWRTEGWLVSDWVAWTVLMAMLFHPVLLLGGFLTGVSLVKAYRAKRAKSADS